MELLVLILCLLCRFAIINLTPYVCMLCVTKQYIDCDKY